MPGSRTTRNLVTAAVFAAAIAVTTAWILHIPLPTGGYIHVGDALVYLAACMLPLPWAMAAGAVGGAVADLLTAPVWAPATFLIKPVLCLFFTQHRQTIWCGRNAAAAVLAAPISAALYGLVNILLTGAWESFVPQFAGTLIQGIGSGVVFFAFAVACDRAGLKRRLFAA